MDKKKLKQLLYSLGKLLGIVGLLYVLYLLSQEYTWEGFLGKFSSLTPLLPLLLFFNFFSIILGIYAWHIMLLNYAEKTFPFVSSYYHFSKTEIAKYLPGNIFHFIGRQALASKIGITQIQMGKISILFSLLLLAATVLTSTFLTLFAKEIPPYILILMLLSSCLTIVGIWYTYKSFPLSHKIQMNLLFSLSIALQGAMLASIIVYQENHFDFGLFVQYMSIYIVSWLIGFVTPGASGGLGIREGTFIAILSFLEMSTPTDIIIFSVLLIRLINILVDIFLFLSTFLLESKIHKIHPITNKA